MTDWSQHTGWSCSAGVSGAEGGTPGLATGPGAGGSVAAIYAALQSSVSASRTMNGFERFEKEDYCGGAVIIHRDGALLCTIPECTKRSEAKSHRIFVPCFEVFYDRCHHCAGTIALRGSDEFPES
jgi:hypothetical protein